MESRQLPDPSPPPEGMRDVDFYALIIDVIGDQSAGLPAQGQEEAEMSTPRHIWRATRRFFGSAVSLSKAFFVSAATGRPATPTELSPEALRLKREIKEFLEQLRWLEAGETIADPDDIANAPQREWAAETLALALRLKILQRAAGYCRLQGESQEEGDRLKQLIAMHSYYLKRFSLLQGKNREKHAES